MTQRVGSLGGRGEDRRVEEDGSGSEASESFTLVFSCSAAGSTFDTFAFLSTPRGEGERVAEWSGVAQGVRCLEVSLLYSVVPPRGLLSASLHFWVPRGERGRGWQWSGVLRE